MPTPPFLQRVRLRNFKSIRECDVELGPLTFLVGPNGSGKSNFVDALRFVSHALQASLETAVSARNGYNELRRKPGKNVGLHIGLDLHLGGFRPPRLDTWELQLRPDARGGFRVARESCRCSLPFVVHDPGTGEKQVVEGPEYHVANGAAKWNVPFPKPAASPTGLFLTTCSGLLSFSRVDRALKSMSCHNLNPHRMREPQAPDPGMTLAPDGYNLAAMVHRLKDGSREAFGQAIDALRTILPGLSTIERATVGPLETLRFTMSGRGGAATRYYAAQMSDGTLRALGCLVALYGPGSPRTGYAVPFVAVEEPETAVHPGAVRVLLDAMREASLTRQVLVTTHSPDLLDHPDISADQIRAVTMVNGETLISQIDDVAREVLRDRLYTAGELHRLGQLTPAGADG